MKRALAREIERIRNCSRHFIAAVAVPLFSIIFMATIFGDGAIENLPTGIVDLSNSPTSRRIIREAAGSPTLHIEKKHIFTGEPQAKEALANMDIYGYIVIPHNFEEQLQRGESPTITCYYHYALLAAGEEMNGAFTKILSGISASLLLNSGNRAGSTPNQIESVILPSDALFTSTYNASLNYREFLCYPFFFIFFQIFILVFTVYTIGTGSSLQWLESAKGNMLAAIAGKMLPYTILFAVEAVFANVVLFGAAGIPHNGSIATLAANSVLLVVASVSLGIAIASAIPKVSIAISIASMVGALGATASGVTFPLEQMYPPVEWICRILPIRNFIAAYEGIVYNIAPALYNWDNWGAMLVACALVFPASVLLKRNILGGRCRPVATMWGTALVMIGGTVGYGFLYGIMYRPNIVTDVPVAVVNLSQSGLGQEFLRNLNATSNVEICAECLSVKEASELVKRGKVKGIIVLPRNFQPLAPQGPDGRFAVYCPTSSFLNYIAIQKGVSSTMLQMNNTLRTEAVMQLPPQQAAEISMTPTLRINSIALYNRNGGYGSYLLPVAIIVILFQTMLMCGGITAGGKLAHPFKSVPLLTGGYFLLSIFLAGAIPLLFDLPSLADKWELFIFILLFCTASGAFTGAVSLLFRDSEEVMLYVPFFSVGLIFLSGISYPMEQIPHIWQIVSYLLPSSAAITGYVKLNSMGGNLSNVSPQIILLLAQMVIYGTIFILYVRKIIPLQKDKLKRNLQWPNADL